jgi:enamine deaminase RidA (YjgF/YER057c/UK114 family)
VQDIRCDGVPLVGPGALHACRFDDLLFVSGLMALGPAGLADGVRSDPSAPFFQDAAQAQMADILAKARTIFAAAGSELSQVVRALHFHTDLADFPRAHGAWAQELGGLGLPFGAVQAAPGLFVPGARLIVDLWGYAPG